MNFVLFFLSASCPCFIKPYSSRKVRRYWYNESLAERHPLASDYVTWLETLTMYLTHHKPMIVSARYECPASLCLARTQGIGLELFEQWSRYDWLRQREWSPRNLKRFFRSSAKQAAAHKTEPRKQLLWGQCPSSLGTFGNMIKMNSHSTCS